MSIFFKALTVSGFLLFFFSLESLVERLFRGMSTYRLIVEVVFLGEWSLGELAVCRRDMQFVD